MEQQELKNLRHIAEKVLASHGMFLAYAYGSRLHGRPRPDSDLDIGYYLRRNKDREDLSLREEMVLAGELSLQTGYDVDLRCLQHAPLELRARAMIDGERIFCGDEDARPDYESLVLRMYFDQKDVLEQMHEERLDMMGKEARRG